MQIEPFEITQTHCTAQAEGDDGRSGRHTGTGQVKQRCGLASPGALWVQALWGVQGSKSGRRFVRNPLSLGLYEETALQALGGRC